MESTNKDLTKIIQECETMCIKTSSYLLNRPDISQRVNQLKRLRDCSEACVSTAIIYSYNSLLAPKQIELCGEFCRLCASECFRYLDKRSQECAKVCYDCAQACENYSDIENVI